MTNGDDAKQVTVQILDLDWSEIHAAPIIPCNVFAIQGHQSGLVLNCGFADPPIKAQGGILASDVKVRPGIRIAIAHGDVHQLAAALQKNLQDSSETQEMQ